MRVPEAEKSARVLVAPPCLKCQQPFKVRPLHISGVDPCVQYWSCDSCGWVWATRDGQDLRSIRHGETSEKSAWNSKPHCRMPFTKIRSRCGWRPRCCGHNVLSTARSLCGPVLNTVCRSTRSVWVASSQAEGTLPRPRLSNITFAPTATGGGPRYRLRDSEARVRRSLTPCETSGGDSFALAEHACAGDLAADSIRARTFRTANTPRHREWNSASLTFSYRLRRKIRRRAAFAGSLSNLCLAWQHHRGGRRRLTPFAKSVNEFSPLALRWSSRRMAVDCPLSFHHEIRWATPAYRPKPRELARHSWPLSVCAARISIVSWGSTTLVQVAPSSLLTSDLGRSLVIANTDELGMAQQPVSRPLLEFPGFRGQ